MPAVQIVSLPAYQPPQLSSFQKIERAAAEPLHDEIPKEFKIKSSPQSRENSFKKLFKKLTTSPGRLASVIGLAGTVLFSFLKIIKGDFKGDSFFDTVKKWIPEILLLVFSGVAEIFNHKGTKIRKKEQEKYNFYNNILEQIMTKIKDNFAKLKSLYQNKLEEQKRKFNHNSLDNLIANISDDKHDEVLKYLRLECIPLTQYSYVLQTKALTNIKYQGKKYGIMIVFNKNESPEHLVSQPHKVSVYSELNGLTNTEYEVNISIEDLLGESLLPSVSALEKTAEKVDTLSFPCLGNTSEDQGKEPTDNIIKFQDYKNQQSGA